MCYKAAETRVSFFSYNTFILNEGGGSSAAKASVNIALHRCEILGVWIFTSAVFKLTEGYLEVTLTS